MLLIGNGGNGNSVSGGGSGAVTVWYGAAQHVPDNLIVSVSVNNGGNTVVYYRGNSLINLIEASGGSGSTAGAVASARVFGSYGFFKSVAGQAGINGPQGASTTTFLSGGGDNSVITANYGYVNNSVEGFFQMQPIIVGAGGSSSAYVYKGGVGCGGGTAGKGGQGMVLIASW